MRTDKQYKTLMEQQDISAEVTAQFYEKMEKTETRRKPIRWKVALITACLALMIPLTAFAVEYMFGVPKVKLGKLDWHPGPNGYSVRFDNLDSFPLDAFSEKMQNITERFAEFSYTTWETAEEDIGIDLLDNTFLANAERVHNCVSGEGNRSHCCVRCTNLEGQLIYVGIRASYRHDGLSLTVGANIAVEHPKMDEEALQSIHSVEGVITYPENAETTYEAYTTKDGIPTVILRWDLGDTIHYKAVFAVNDISYELDTYADREIEENQKQILLAALDGFEL
ncbi:MAG: hypothetical protein IJ388_04390 [Oscillospiraceae bacterium]|nr:hypothetical protein [Oscillospiraceae bacterium]